VCLRVTAGVRRMVALAVDAVLGMRRIPAPCLVDLSTVLPPGGDGPVDAVGMVDADVVYLLGGARLVPADAWEALAQAEARR
jgi:hypothetical protein